MIDQYINPSKEFYLDNFTFGLNLSAGLISQLKPPVRVFGRNTLIQTTTLPEDIWNGGGVYTGFNNTTTGTISVVSASALDTSNGTGARQIRIFGLDANWNEIREDIIRDK